MRGDVQALDVFVARFGILQNARILPQVLQVFGGFLQKEFDAFALHDAHERPSVATSGFCNSSAVGLRYRMQSFNTMA